MCTALSPVAMPRSLVISIVPPLLVLLLLAAGTGAGAGAARADAQAASAVPWAARLQGTEHCIETEAAGHALKRLAWASLPAGTAPPGGWPVYLDLVTDPFPYARSPSAPRESVPVRAKAPLVRARGRGAPCAHPVPRDGHPARRAGSTHAVVLFAGVPLGRQARTAVR